MFSKVIIVLACLYVVQAAFVINAPDDAVGSSDVFSKSVKSCGAAECNQHCRKMGYARGVCIGTYCQCRTRMALGGLLKGSEEADSDVSKQADEVAPDSFAENDNEDEINNDEDMADDFSVPETYENDAGLAARGCGNSNCNSFCRRRGYARGRCISSRVCRCYKYRVTLWDPEDDSQNSNLLNNGEKSNKVAESSQIDDFNTLEMSSDDNSEAAGALATCTNNLCNAFCKSRGYIWGHCISANICRCYYARRSLNENNDEDVKAFVDIQNDDVATDFNTQELPSEGDSEAASALASARACTNNLCNAFCKSRGYIWGHCISANICRCYYARRRLNENNGEEVNMLDNIQDDNEVTDYNTQQLSTDDNSEAASGLASARACTNNLCNSFCKSRGHIWGHCISANICRCYGIARSLKEAEMSAVRNCNLRNCEQSCRRIGFPGGACVNGRCKCDILRRELPSPIPAPGINPIPILGDPNEDIENQV